MEKKLILILVALPNILRFAKEFREIQEAIRRAVSRDLFEIRIRIAVRSMDIRRALAEERPQIIHFYGNGQDDGSLVLEDDNGNYKPVLPKGLAQLFMLYTDCVRCVLLNASHSAELAEAIAQHIHYVVGMNPSIEDNATIEFTRAFYDGLGYADTNNRSIIRRALDEGIVAITLENLSQGGSLPIVWESGIIQANREPIVKVIPVASANHESTWCANSKCF